MLRMLRHAVVQLLGLRAGLQPRPGCQLSGIWLPRYMYVVVAVSIQMAILIDVCACAPNDIVVGSRLDVCLRVLFPHLLYREPGARVSVQHRLRPI